LVFGKTPWFINVVGPQKNISRASFAAIRSVGIEVLSASCCEGRKMSIKEESFFTIEEKKIAANENRNFFLKFTHLLKRSIFLLYYYNMILNTFFSREKKVDNMYIFLQKVFFECRVPDRYLLFSYFSKCRLTKLLCDHSL